MLASARVPGTVCTYKINRIHDFQCVTNLSGLMMMFASEKKVASWIDFVLARKMREMVSTEGLGNVRAIGIMLRSATQIN